MYNWTQIREYVLQRPHQQDLLVLKDSVVPPQMVGIPYAFGAYRYTVADGKVIDIKEDGDYWHVHWDKHNPSTYLIEHALDDAPMEWLLATSGIGAAIKAANAPKGKESKAALDGALEGLGWGVLALLLWQFSKN